MPVVRILSSNQGGTQHPDAKKSLRPWFSGDQREKGEPPSTAGLAAVWAVCRVGRAYQARARPV